MRAEYPAHNSFHALSCRKRRGPSNRQDLSPLSAEGYFSQALSVQVPISNIYPTPTAEATSSSSNELSTADFRVYYTAPSSTSQLVQQQQDEEDEGEGNPNGVVFVCVHGAGYSGLSYACTAKELVEKGGGKIGVLAFDARGHGKACFFFYSYSPSFDTIPLVGKTKLPNSEREGEQTSMELKSMASDLISLLETVFPQREKAPGLVLVGHSMVSRLSLKLTAHNRSLRRLMRKPIFFFFTGRSSCRRSL